MNNLSTKKRNKNQKFDHFRVFCINCYYPGNQCFIALFIKANPLLFLRKFSLFLYTKSIDLTKKKMYTLKVCSILYY